MIHNCPLFGGRNTAKAEIKGNLVNVGRGGATPNGRSGRATEGDDEEEDCCSICQEGLADADALDTLGEPLTTGCGHRFHACCYARLMETSSTHDPLCPLCRSGNLSARFRTST